MNNDKYSDRSDKRRTIFIRGTEKNSQGGVEAWSSAHALPSLNTVTKSNVFYVFVFLAPDVEEALQ